MQKENTLYPDYFKFKRELWCESLKESHLGIKPLWVVVTIGEMFVNWKSLGTKNP